MSLLKGLSCVLVMLLTGNSISLSGHPFCCSSWMVSQRMESGSPALAKLCALQHQQENIRGAAGEWACYKTTQPPDQVSMVFMKKGRLKGPGLSDPSWPHPPRRTRNTPKTPFSPSTAGKAGQAG